MSLITTLRSATLAGLLLLPVPDRLAACAFHTTLPQATLSDDIAASVEVIAARPSAADPFRFEPVAVLKGEASGERPPFIVDSVTRKHLLDNPDEAVLFARGTDGSWTRLLLLDAATRPLVDLMIARTESWVTSAGAEDRRDAFANLLSHPDARLRRIALRELDALPYGILRGGAYPVEVAELLEGLANIDEMPFAPIRILLLGLDEGDIAREAITRRLAVMAKLRLDTNLGAWITAAIESGGDEGIASVERVLTTGSSGKLADTQLTEIVRAFSVVSAEGDPALRSALDGAIRRLVYLDPAAAPLIAQAFGATADYSQTGLIRELAAARAFTTRADLLAAAAYLSRATSGARGAKFGRTSSSPRGLTDVRADR